MIDTLQVRDRILPGLAAISGIVTAQPISTDILMARSGTLALRVSVKVSSVTQVGTLTCRLQGKTANGSYANLASANSTQTFTANGTLQFNLVSTRTADQADMPLPEYIQVVMTTTDAGDRITVNSVYVQQ